MKPIYIDGDLYRKIMDRASNNNGRVVFDSKGYPPFEVEVDVALAKQIQGELIGSACEALQRTYGISREKAMDTITQFDIWRMGPLTRSAIEERILGKERP